MQRASAAEHNKQNVGWAGRARELQTPMQNETLNYKWKATTLEGFIQQLAVAYVARGYYFYVTGSVPSRIPPLTNTIAECSQSLISQ